jgi:GH35 family endo-1,4-beta-xylanase
MPTSIELARGEEIFAAASANVERCRKGKASLRLQDAAGLPISGQEVEIVQKTQDFLFGNLLFDLVWSDPPYKPDLFKQRFRELFNLGILPFYWSMYERVPGRPQWEQLLPALAWCQANGVTPKGHPLVWPYDAGVPEWLYDMPEGAVEPLIRARVLNTVRGFKDAIQIWDVTNEAVNHISWSSATAPAFKARSHETSDWRGIPVAGAFKGEVPIKAAADWVEQSLRWAYAANPRAALIVNDYNQEIDPRVRRRFYELARELLDRGAPISGIGLQVHPLDHWIWPAEIWDTLEMYADLHLPVHITELHQPSWTHPIEGGWREGSWDEEKQAEFIAGLYRLCYGHPSVASINYWGLSDRNIWIESAGLIDAEYQPKPVFNALKSLIKGQWMTPAFSAVTDAAGRIEFSGFYGQYEVTLKHTGRRHETVQVHLAEGMGNDWNLTGESALPPTAANTQQSPRGWMPGRSDA